MQSYNNASESKCLPSCNSVLFNPQVRLETLLDFQSKDFKKCVVSIFLLQNLPSLHLEPITSSKWMAKDPEKSFLGSLMLLDTLFQL